MKLKYLMRAAIPEEETVCCRVIHICKQLIFLSPDFSLPSLHPITQRFNNRRIRFYIHEITVSTRKGATDRT
ncbi:hypothetical protein PGTUg99_012552, partial [Puccinia graminis f. sp. tritici]